MAEQINPRSGRRKSLLERLKNVSTEVTPASTAAENTTSSEIQRETRTSDIKAKSAVPAERVLSPVQEYTRTEPHQMPKEPASSRSKLREELEHSIDKALRASRTNDTSEAEKKDREVRPSFETRDVQDILDQLQPHLRRMSEYIERDDVTIHNRRSVERDVMLSEDIISTCKNQTPQEACEALSQLLHILTRYTLPH